MHCNDRTGQAGSENSLLEYLLEESVQVQICENRLADKMQEGECCLKPSAGMYCMTLGGVNQIQHRKGGSSSSGCDAQTFTAARSGGPHTPITFNDGMRPHPHPPLPKHPQHLSQAVYNIEIADIF